MTKSEADQFILSNYYKLTCRQIATTLGMPIGSVITRHAIITGKRKGSLYKRADGAIIHYDYKQLLKPPDPPVRIACANPNCDIIFTRYNPTQIYCDAICGKRTRERRRRLRKANKCPT